jgi:glycosyltransferase involved in cell wall biosynthesis
MIVCAFSAPGPDAAAQQTGISGMLSGSYCKSSFCTASPSSLQPSPNGSVLKVFLAATSFRHSYGGPALSVSRLALALADAGAYVGLWAPDGSAVQSEMIESAHPALTCLTGPVQEALFYFGRPDVVHDNGIWLPHNHRLARLTFQRGIPRIVSARGMLEAWALRHKKVKKRIALRLYQKYDLQTAALHHATADAEAASIAALRLGVPIRVIANGVDIPAACGEDIKRYVGQQPDKLAPRIALFLSRIHPKKGLPMLIEAWKQVQPRGWLLHIAGPGEGGHLAEVRKLVSAASLKDTVRFLGPIESRNKSAVYNSADLFVLPTYSENFGMVVAEALAHGVPVLTTKGTPWAHLEEQRCGWVVNATPEGIIGGLNLALSSNSRALREMGNNGRAMMREKFAWEAIGRQFLASYRGLASKAARISSKSRAGL